MYTHKKMKTNAENSLQLLKEVLPVLEAQESFDNDSLFAALSAFGKEHEYKTGFVMWPLRTAVSGKQATPGERLTEDTFDVHFEKAYADVQGAYA